MQRSTHNMTTLFVRIFVIALFGGMTQMAHTEELVAARYAEPVSRYGHFALGRPHEYAEVIATTDNGRNVIFQLPETEVFEDLAPRLVRLKAGDSPQLLVIASNRFSGSRLMLLALRGDQLLTSAQSLPIGVPMRWLNPVAVADLDGDGLAEIAAVVTPHIGGTLKIYQRRGEQLVEIAKLPGFSNHIYGTPELALSASIAIADKTFLLVPDATRKQLRVIGLENRRLIERGRCTLPASISGAINIVSPTQVAVGLSTGREVLTPGDCPR